MAEKNEKTGNKDKQDAVPPETQAGSQEAGPGPAGAAVAAAGGAAGSAGARVAGAVKKARKKVAAEAIVHIRSTFNNTLVNITDVKGNVICWNSPGKSGFKGSRKSTPFAAQIAAEVAGKMAFDAGVRKVEVHIQGAGNGRESAIRAIASTGIKISAIKDYTSIPHNGCRPPKRRRV